MAGPRLSYSCRHDHRTLLAESSAQARSASRFTAAVSRGLRESAVIALGVVALVLLMALATYSPR